jgi:hypothetical protein
MVGISVSGMQAILVSVFVVCGISVPSRFANDGVQDLLFGPLDGHATRLAIT